jgi:hypothetical protein
MVSPSPQEKEAHSMKNRHIFNRTFAFGISKKALVAMAIFATFPAVAMAGPSVGIGYTNIGLSGHGGRPGVTLSAGNMYKHGIVAAGNATIASNFGSFNTQIGKELPVTSTVSVEPYLSAGFTNINYAQAPSLTDFYGLAGANVNMPVTRNVSFGLGGSYGHTIGSYGSAGGQVYTGDAIAAFKIAPHVSSDLSVSYMHIPGQGGMQYSAGLAYHFS